MGIMRDTIGTVKEGTFCFVCCSYPKSWAFRQVFWKPLNEEQRGLSCRGMNGFRVTWQLTASYACVVLFSFAFIRHQRNRSREGWHFFHLKKGQGNLGLLKQEGLKLDSNAGFLTLRKVQEYLMSLKSLLSKRLENLLAGRGSKRSSLVH